MSTKKKKKRKKKQHRFFWFVIKLQIVLMLVVLAGFGYYYFGGYADQIQQMRREAVQEVSASDDSTFIPSQTCSVFDKDGKLISERRGDKNAQYVKYEDIPKNFVAAIISIEDKKFYQHNGVDLKGLVRAVKATVMSKLKKIAGWYAGWKYDYHAACQADLYAAETDVAVQGEADVSCVGTRKTLQ